MVKFSFYVKKKSNLTNAFISLNVVKNILYTLALLFCFSSFGQTPITDSNFYDAIRTCLSTNPVDGMCSDSEYGAMPYWDVSNVTNMKGAFAYQRSFDANISNWDVSNVIDMSSMFANTAFNQPIGDWDVSNVRSMYDMFRGSKFNQPLGNWDVSNVTDMGGMFEGASSFNQSIRDWDVSNVYNMRSMFKDALNFNQDLSKWSVENVGSCIMFNRGLTSWKLPQPNFTNCNP